MAIMGMESGSFDQGYEQHFSNSLSHLIPASPCTWNENVKNLQPPGKVASQERLKKTRRGVPKKRNYQDVNNSSQSFTNNIQPYQSDIEQNSNNTASPFNFDQDENFYIQNKPEQKKRGRKKKSHHIQEAQIFQDASTTIKINHNIDSKNISDGQKLNAPKKAQQFLDQNLLSSFIQRGAQNSVVQSISVSEESKSQNIIGEISGYKIGSQGVDPFKYQPRRGVNPRAKFHI